MIGYLRNTHNILYTASFRQQLIANSGGPETCIHQVLQEILIHHLRNKSYINTNEVWEGRAYRKFTSQYPTVVHIRCKGLCALIIAKNLSRGSSGHGCQKQ